MDKLQWFKFSYADWRMGKIQRCPEITQSRFINLCCLYWSKECLLSYEDAEIEIDKEHLDILIKKKIVSNINESINISFLDEQFAEIEDKKKDRSFSGVIGNLKRWKPDIYNLYQDKKITLEEAISMSKNIAEVSLPDSPPIATQSQKVAEKRRGEEIREEDNKPKKVFSLDFDKLLEFIRNETKRNYRTINDNVKRKYIARLKEGYKQVDIKNSIRNACKTQYHKDNGFQYLTPEFFSRADTLDKYSSQAIKEVQFNPNQQPRN